MLWYHFTTKSEPFLKKIIKGLKVSAKGGQTTKNRAGKKACPVEERGKGVGGKAPKKSLRDPTG